MYLHVSIYTIFLFTQCFTLHILYLSFCIFVDNHRARLIMAGPSDPSGSMCRIHQTRPNSRTSSRIFLSDLTLTFMLYMFSRPSYHNWKWAITNVKIVTFRKLSNSSTLPVPTCIATFRFHVVPTKTKQNWKITTKPLMAKNTVENLLLRDKWHTSNHFSKKQQFSIKIFTYQGL